MNMKKHEIVYGSGAIISTEYDEKGNVIQYKEESDGSVYCITREYDDNNNCINKVDSDGEGYIKEYDEEGRLVKREDLITHDIETYNYEPDGSYTTVSMHNDGNIIFKSYDTEKRIILSVSNKNGVTLFRNVITYSEKFPEVEELRISYSSPSSAIEPINTTDLNGFKNIEVTKNYCDEKGRIIKTEIRDNTDLETKPVKVFITEYNDSDDGGFVVQRKFADDHVYSCDKYDSQNRLISEIRKNGTQVIEYSDDGSKTVMRYDAGNTLMELGKIRSISEYDSNNKIKYKRICDNSNKGDFEEWYTYNENGDIVTYINSNNESAEYVYDTENHHRLIVKYVNNVEVENHVYEWYND